MGVRWMRAPIVIASWSHDVRANRKRCIMTTMSDAFKDIFLAGVGAVAMGAEKSKELIDQLMLLAMEP